jgi:hypothetical protein
MSSDWAKHIAGLKRKELADQRLREQKDLSDRQMLESHAIPMWQDVIKATHRHIEELNREMGEGSVAFAEIESARSVGADPYRFTILAGVNQGEVEFDRVRARIQSFGGSYQLTVIQGNGVVWKSDKGTNSTSDDIARSAIGTVFLRKS